MEKMRKKGDKDIMGKGDKRAGVVAIAVWTAACAGAAREERHGSWFCSMDRKV
jgi:hypothetical protein